MNVGLVQINNSFSGQNYFPYSTGVLQAYALRNLARPGDFRFLPPIYSRLPVERAVEGLLDADIVAFSTYVWNSSISLRIAEALKARKPDTLIVFGGPHVPDRVEPFLRKHRFIDVACHGEGERAFTGLLERAGTRDWTGVPSLSWLGEDGTLRQNPKAERIRDLSTVPSPFLDGVFDPLIAANPQEHWIAVWETNRGCPFSCTFCDWGSAVANKVVYWDLERLKRELDWFAAHKVEFIFCADANFGILPRDVDIVKYCAEVKKARGYPQAMSVQNTKNATERSYQVQKVLSDAGLNKGVVVSLQSVDPRTLEAIKRDNISLETYHEIQRRFAAQGVETMTDLILGLPEETYDSFSRGVATVIENGQHNRIQFNNLSLLPNAEMGDPDYQRRYGMETVETKVVNIHGELVVSKDEVVETQELVIATSAMPRGDWARTRAFCWMTGLLYFDKLLQVPIVLLRRTCGVGYKEILETFSEGRFAELPGSFPVLERVRGLFLEKARDIQAGGLEYVHSKDWLNIWWPADEYVLIELCTSGRLDAFYAEAERVLAALAEKSGGGLPREALADAVRLNNSLLKRPFQTEDLRVELSYNVWELYRSVVVGRPVDLERVPRAYHIDRTRETWPTWEDWYRKVVWWGNKKGAYLYGNTALPSEGQLAGHY